VTYEKIKDWYALREAVECQVVRILAKHVTPGELQHLEEMAKQLDDLEQSRETGEYFWELHYEMHLIMAQYTGHQSLIDSLKRINLFHLLQRAQLSATEHRSQIPKDNHSRIVKAIRNGDPQYAEEMMREHIYHSGIFDSSEKNITDPSPVRILHS
jgi:DNA-binding GntR family transcriptional regulator